MAQLYFLYILKRAMIIPNEEQASKEPINVPVTTYRVKSTETRGELMNFGTLQEVDGDDQELEHTFAHQPVPIFLMTSEKQSLKLVETQKEKEYRNWIAKGKLIGSFNGQMPNEEQEPIICTDQMRKRIKLRRVDAEYEFRGNFQGVFQGSQDQGEIKDRSQSGGIGEEGTDTQLNRLHEERDSGYVYYFEGSIQCLSFLKINGEPLNDFEMKQSQDVTAFKGFFRGVFLPREEDSRVREEARLERGLKSDERQKLDNELITRKISGGASYYVPTSVRFDIRKFASIDLGRSSGLVSGTLVIDIKLNQALAKELKKCWTKGQKHQLSIDFQRDKPLVLPFYDPSDFEESEQETELEWDDPLDDIDLEVDWVEEDFRMHYVIRSQFRSEIDNSYGMFFAPFNLNVLRFVLTFHPIKISKDCKLHMVLTDMQDFNGDNYNPYTTFNQLDVDKSQNDPQHFFAKQIDRLSKVTVNNFRDQGEYNIASNRIALYPYHKRIFLNTNSLTDDYTWTLGLAQRTKNMERPSVKSVKEGYQQARKTGEADMFKMTEWEFLHIEIPVFKYATIDLINIFVPIIILSTISILFFHQENGKMEDGITSLGKRIASGAGLLLAFVAMIPIVRDNLPPTPSITFLQIIIYVSTIPNFLALIASIIENTLTVLQFFNSYRAFTDPLFLTSFILTMISWVVLAISLFVYVNKDYRAAYTIQSYNYSPMSRIRAPLYLRYMNGLIRKRQEKRLLMQPIRYLQQ